MGNNAIILEQALQILLGHIDRPDRYEELPLLEALGRILYDHVQARIDQPPFNRSPLDGYAVHHEDLKSATKGSPAVLRVSQCIYAGDWPRQRLQRGQAAVIMTGSPLPDGATCVVRQEDTDRGESTVQINVSHGKHQNVCFRGEDVEAGRLLVSKGTSLDYARIGVLAGQGISRVRVYPKPRIGVLSTGSELMPVGEQLQPGKIYDSNRYTLMLRAMELGAEPALDRSLPDVPQLLSSAIDEALPHCDLLMTTGGVSVGARDYMPMVGEMIGAQKLFHGVAVKPGHCALALKKDGKLIICLSGNPFAAFATFELLAAPLIRKLSGGTSAGKRIRANMLDTFDKASQGRRFVRARFDSGQVFFPTDDHEAGVLSSLIDCNCLIDIPAGNSGLKRGDTVEVVLF